MSYMWSVSRIPIQEDSQVNSPIKITRLCIFDSASTLYLYSYYIYLQSNFMWPLWLQSQNLRIQYTENLRNNCFLRNCYNNKCHFTQWLKMVSLVLCGLANIYPYPISTHSPSPISEIQSILHSFLFLHTCSGMELGQKEKQSNKWRYLLHVFTHFLKLQV